jgi:hypothetical protein
LIRTLTDIQTCTPQAFLFGGTLRDLMVCGASAIPRDVDVVVGDISSQALRAALASHLDRETRFGGLRLEVEGWFFDVWTLKDTWAFRQGILKHQSFQDLPKTTFLNVEAVAADLNVRRGQKRCVYANGFFEGLLSRTVEINLEENPFPELCVVRSLITAAELGYAIGPRLSRYLVHYGTKAPMEQLIHVQESHYGRIRCSEGRLASWIDAIRIQLRTSSKTSARLPDWSHRQSMIWDTPVAVRSSLST